MNLWDIDGTDSLEDAEPLRLPDHHGDLRVVDAAQLEDGRVLTVADSPTILAWDPADPETEAREFGAHDKSVKAITVLSDGNVATAGGDKVIKIWNQDGELQLELTGHRTTVNDLLALPDGRLASTAFDGTLRIWDLSDPDNPTDKTTDVGLAGRLALIDDSTLAMNLGSGWLEVSVDP